MYFQEIMYMKRVHLGGKLILEFVGIVWTSLVSKNQTFVSARKRSGWVLLSYWLLNQVWRYRNAVKRLCSTCYYKLSIVHYSPMLATIKSRSTLATILLNSRMGKNCVNFTGHSTNWHVIMYTEAKHTCHSQNTFVILIVKSNVIIKKMSMVWHAL